MAPSTAISPLDGPVAVTGASGFIGSWVVADLVEAGYTVRACVRDITSEDKTAHLLAMNDHGRGSVELFSADITAPGSYDGPFAGCAGVIHSGAVISAQHDTLDEEGKPRGRKYTPQQVYDGCFTEVRHIVNSFKRSGAKRLVFTSSCAAVIHPGPEGQFVPGYLFTEKDWCWDNNKTYTMENMPNNGGIAYCMAKANTEKMLYEEASASGGAFECMSILPMHVIGPIMAPNHDQLGTWQNCIRGMMEGSNHPKGWNKNGQMFWNMVDVRDVAGAHRLCLELPHVDNGSRYILSATDDSGEMPTHQLQANITRLFPQLTKVGGEAKVDGELPTTPAVMHAHCTLACKELGLQTHSFEDTLRATGESYLALRMIKAQMERSKL